MSLFEAYEKREEIWAQVVKYFDILDAYMESLLESLDYKNADFEPIAARYKGQIQEIA